MIWLKLLRPFLPYIVGAAICGALVAGWRVSVSNAYDQGYEARKSEQAAADAEALRSIIEEYTNATSDPITPDIADCLLRELAGLGTGENCRDLPSIQGRPH